MWVMFNSVRVDNWMIDTKINLLLTAAAPITVSLVEQSQRSRLIGHGCILVFVIILIQRCILNVYQFYATLLPLDIGLIPKRNTLLFRYIYSQINVILIFLFRSQQYVLCPFGKRFLFGLVKSQRLLLEW